MEGWIIAALSLGFMVLMAVGGTVWRLASKIYQVEIWARDEFVRKGSFEMVVARLEKSMDTLGSKIEAAVEKMAARIEHMDDRRDDRRA